MSESRTCSICEEVKEAKLFELTNREKGTRRKQCMTCRNKGLNASHAKAAARLKEVEATLPVESAERAIAIEDHNARELEATLRALQRDGAREFKRCDRRIDEALIEQNTMGEVVERLEAEVAELKAELRSAREQLAVQRSANREGGRLLIGYSEEDLTLARLEMRGAYSPVKAHLRFSSRG